MYIVIWDSPSQCLAPHLQLRSPYLPGLVGNEKCVCWSKYKMIGEVVIWWDDMSHILNSECIKKGNCSQHHMAPHVVLHKTMMMDCSSWMEGDDGSARDNGSHPSSNCETTWESPDVIEVFGIAFKGECATDPCRLVVMWMATNNMSSHGWGNE